MTDAPAFPAEIKAAFDKFDSAVSELHRKTDEKIAETKKGFDDVVRRDELKRIDDAVAEIKAQTNAAIADLKRPQLDAKGRPVTAEMAEYKTRFETWFRKGHGEEGLRGFEQKAMSVQSDPDGGYTVIPEMESAIDATLKIVSPFRQYASVRQIGSNSLKSLVNTHGTTSGWVGETETRAETATAALKELEFPVMEIYAEPRATQTALDDSYLNLEQFLADEVSVEFAFQEGSAFINGNGVKKPWGILGYTPAANASYAWGNPGYIATGNSGAFAASNPADKIVDLYHALRIPYRNGAVWMCNNNLLSTIRQMKDGQSNYLVQRTFASDGIVEMLMGKPVAEMNDMPDAAANSYSLAFGDFKRAYQIVDRVGIRVLRDPFTAKPYVKFYTTKRVGGGVKNFEAYKLMKFAAS